MLLYGHISNMDRFAFKIDKALKANLYKICRLCGIDNPEQVPIINENCNEVPVNVDEDPEISQKIQELIGFVITKDDKMPQNICSLCMDKLNDFYEFREMCYATNVQTRRLLGLKLDDPRKTCCAVKSEPGVKYETIIGTSPSKKGPRKRKSDEETFSCPFNSWEVLTLHKKSKVNQMKKVGTRSGTSLRAPKYEDADNDFSPDIHVAVKRDSQKDSLGTSICTSKLKELCDICEQKFLNKFKLQQHKKVAHVPNIPRYVCSTCNESYNKNSDIKTHQLWHKLSKTPYTCALCRESIASSYLFSRHLKEHSLQPVPPTLLVLDRRCPQCQEKFVTNFLYNIHSCAVQTKKCPGCKKKQRTTDEYLAHIPFCAKSFLNHSKIIKNEQGVVAETYVPIMNENEIEAAEAAASLGLDFDNAAEQDGTTADTPSMMDSLTSTPSKHKKHSKHSGTKEHIKRIDDLLKSTLDALVSIKHEPGSSVETESLGLDETTEGSRLTSAHDDDNENEMSDNYDMDCFQNHDEDDDTDIDMEDSFSTGVAEDAQNATSALDTSSNISVTIKEEPKDASFPSDKIPTLKLKIRKEHGRLNSSLVDGDEHIKEKKKKKKKRREKETTWVTDDKESRCTSNDTLPLKIKDEPQEDKSEKEKSTQLSLISNTSVFSQPTLPIMTSIPMGQLQMSYTSSELSELIGPEFPLHQVGDQTYDSEYEDVKPNRSELDSMLKISSVKSIAELPSEETSHGLEQNDSHIYQSPSKKAKKDDLYIKPEIMTDFGDSQCTFNHVIKPEPTDSGYSEALSSSCSVNEDTTNEILPHYSIVVKKEILDPREEEGEPETFYNNCENSQILPLSTSLPNEEQQYIDSIDFNSMQIKQEKELDLNDAEQLGDTPNDKTDKSGVETGTNSDDSNGESEPETDEEEGDLDNEEQREYREMEEPPLLDLSIHKTGVPFSETINKGLSTDKSDINVEDMGNTSPNACDVKPPIMTLQISNVTSGYIHLAQHNTDLFDINLVKKEPVMSSDSDYEGDQSNFTDSLRLVEDKHFNTSQLDSSVSLTPVSLIKEENTGDLHQEQGNKNVFDYAETLQEAPPTIVESKCKNSVNETSSIQFSYEETKEAELVDARPFFNITVNTINNLEEENNENMAVPERMESDIESQGTEEEEDEEEEEEGVGVSLNTSLQIEEQQNLVNNEIENERPELRQAEDRLSFISTSMNETSDGDVRLAVALSSMHTEVVDNLINEHNDALADSGRYFVVNNPAVPTDNINEIAENHNNANIERELMDESIQHLESESPSLTENPQVLNLSNDEEKACAASSNLPLEQQENRNENNTPTSTNVNLTDAGGSFNNETNAEPSSQNNESFSLF